MTEPTQSGANPNTISIVDMHAHPLLDRLYAVHESDEPCDAESCPLGKRLGLDALTRGHVGVVVSAIYPFWTPSTGSAYMARCHDILGRLETHLEKHAESATVARNGAELALAQAEGKIAFIHAVEGGHVLEGRAENLELLYQWGVRSLTITHFMNNALAAASFDPRRKLKGHNGLTAMGREVVTAMNGLGMIVDLAHCSEQAFWEALDVSRQPVMVSHTGIRRLVPAEICLSDEQLKAMAQNGGVVGVILSSIWLRRYDFLAGVDELVANILYICERIGADHVGIGSDLNGTPRLRDVSTAAALPAIWSRLQERGVADRDVAKIMGGNFLRLFSQVVGS